MEQSALASKVEVAKAKGNSKHLQKMQTDMQEWRRSNDDGHKAKQKQLESAQTKIDKLKADKKRTKAEVTMLRNNQKEIRDGTALENLK